MGVVPGDVETADAPHHRAFSGEAEPDDEVLDLNTLWVEREDLQGASVGGKREPHREAGAVVREGQTRRFAEVEVPSVVDTWMSTGTTSSAGHSWSIIVMSSP